jgi:hypothetical protein
VGTPCVHAGGENLRARPRRSSGKIRQALEIIDLT